MPNEYPRDTPPKRNINNEQSQIDWESGIGRCIRTLGLWAAMVYDRAGVIWSGDDLSDISNNGLGPLGVGPTIPATMKFKVNTGTAISSLVGFCGIPDDYESPILVTTLCKSAGDIDGTRRNAEIGVERAEKLLQDYPDNYRAYYLGAGALRMLGQSQRATEWIKRGLELGSGDSATQYNAACFYANDGDIDRALDCLEGSIISRTWIENDADLDPLRDHPRYEAIVASLPE